MSAKSKAKQAIAEDPFQRMLRKRTADAPKIEELEVLLGWPKGSLNDICEREAIAALHHLGCMNGFGRIEQLAAQIYEISISPNRKKTILKFKKAYKMRMKELKASEKMLLEMQVKAHQKTTQALRGMAADIRKGLKDEGIPS